MHRPLVPLTMLLVQQLHLLQHILAHLGKPGSSLLAAAQDQAVLIVACAHSVQGLSEGLRQASLSALLGGPWPPRDRWGWKAAGLVQLMAVPQWPFRCQ